MVTVAGRGSGGRSSYGSMQSILQDQEAVVQAMKEAAENLATASHMLLNSTIENNQSRSGNGVPGSGPNGGRPTVGDNQTQRPDHGAGAAHKKGLAGVRSMVANQVHGRWGSGSGPTFTPTRDAQGNHTGYTQHNTNGTSSFRPIGDPGLDEDVARAAGRGSISKVAGAFGEGGALAGVKAVPYVGTAIMAAEAGHEVLTQVGKQREANAQYQGIYGGSNFGTGFSNRLQETGFSLGQMFSGGLTSAQSKQAFQGVSELGLQGSQRSSDLSFISSSYKSLGMGVSDSLKLVQTATKGLNTDLSGLKDALKSVSDAAKTTGQNANAARNAFTNTYAQVSGSSPGAMAAPISAAIATTQTGLGRGMSSINLSGVLTTLTGQAQAASSLGMSIPQFSAAMLQDPATALKGLDNVVDQSISSFMTPQVQAQIQALISSVPGGASTLQTNPDQIIANPNFAKLVSMVNGNSLMQVINTKIPNAGVTDPDHAVLFLVEYALGLTSTSGAFAKSQQGNAQNPGAIKSGVTAGGTPTRGGGGNGGAAAASRAQNSAYQSKGYNPVIDKAKTTLKGQHITVTDKTGPKVVTLDEAIKDYTDQIATGTATVTDTGQSVKDALGGATEANYKGNGDQYNKGDTANANYGAAGTSSSSANSAKGETVDAYNAAKAKSDAKKLGGTIIVQGSQTLLNLLNIQTSGNVKLATVAAADGSTPMPGQTPLGGN